MPGKPGLSAAVSGGTRLDALRALRDDLARQIEGCESSQGAAALSRVLVQVLEQIDELAPPLPAKGTVLDEVKAKRAERATAGASGAARVRKRG
jgi:hypothetical protein